MKNLTQHIVRFFFSLVLFFSMNIQATANYVYLENLTENTSLEKKDASIFTNTATEQESENEVPSINELLEEMLGEKSLKLSFLLNDCLVINYTHYRASTSSQCKGMTTPPPEFS